MSDDKRKSVRGDASEESGARGETESTGQEAGSDEVQQLGSSIRAEAVREGGTGEGGEGEAGHSTERTPASAQQRIDALEAELANAKDQALRALAEAENTRRRAEKERQDMGKYGAAGLARDVLAVADNLRRALDAIGADAREKDQALDTLATGVEMTEKMLLEALEKHGVKKIDPLSEPFDHNYHQAMMEVESDSVAGGHVAQVMQPGYVLHDRLLRPAMVAVAKKNKGDAGGDKPKVDTTA